jgi:chemotaxis protein methyltransferase CheR
MNYTLSESTFTQLAELIKEKTGIHIPPTKKYLIENRLFKVIEDYNLKGYDEYLYMVRYSRNGKEVDRLCDSITTNETYFFREPLQFNVFIEHILPRIIENKQGMKNLRVWSAACSSGEEPYTLSMLLKEKRPDIMAELMGTDISKRVLQSAERGIFSSYSVRNVDNYFMRKYFTPKGESFALDEKIKSSVRYRHHNMLSGLRPPELNNLDVVFCRNVLIYFDIKTKQEAVSTIYDSLSPGGYMIIGSSESLHNVTRAFKPITIDKVVAYEKI